MRTDEALAALLFEAIHSGAEMSHNSSQARGEWDFDLVLPTGERQPVEVTISTDRQRQRLYAAVLNDQGSFVTRVLARNDWYVTPYANANIQRVRREIDRYLADVEASDVSEFHDGIMRYPEPVKRLCTDLRIEAGIQFNWNPPGRIGLALPGYGGTLSGEAVVSDVEAEARKSDNRKKLGRSTSNVRHLAVIFGDLSGVSRASMIGNFFPERPAELPPEVTIAWAITRLHGAADQYLVWKNEFENPWETVGVIEVPGAAIDARAG